MTILTPYPARPQNTRSHDLSEVHLTLASGGDVRLVWGACGEGWPNEAPSGEP